MNYQEMLKKGRKELPESVSSRERFEIPKVKGHYEGTKTVVNNFNQIADTLERPPEHVLKYILREIATPGDLKNNILILKAKIPAVRINEKIEKYASEFVICKDCGKPDTEIIKEGQLSYLKCKACGSKKPINSKI